MAVETESLDSGLYIEPSKSSLKELVVLNLDEEDIEVLDEDECEMDE